MSQDSVVPLFTAIPDVQLSHSMKIIVDSVCQYGGPLASLEFARTLDDSPFGFRLAIVQRINDQLETGDSIVFLREYLQTMQSSVSSGPYGYNPLFEYAISFMLTRELEDEVPSRNDEARWELSRLLEKMEQFPCEAAKILARIELLRHDIAEFGRHFSEWDEHLKVYDAIESYYRSYCKEGSRMRNDVEMVFFFRALVRMGELSSKKRFLAKWYEDAERVKRHWFLRALPIAESKGWHRESLYLHHEILRSMLLEESKPVEDIQMCYQWILEDIHHISKGLRNCDYGRKQISSIVGIINDTAYDMIKLTNTRFLNTEQVTELLRCGLDMARMSLGANHPRIAQLSARIAYMHLLMTGKEVPEYEAAARTILNIIAEKEASGDEMLVFRNIETITSAHYTLGWLYCLKGNSLDEFDREFTRAEDLNERFFTAFGNRDGEDGFDTNGMFASSNNGKKSDDDEHTTQAIDNLKKELEWEEFLGPDKIDVNRVNEIHALIAYYSQPTSAIARRILGRSTSMRCLWR